MVFWIVWQNAVLSAKRAGKLANRYSALLVLSSGRNPSSTGFSFCKDFPLCYRQETVAGILKKNRTGWELRIKNTFQKRAWIFIFCVKTHNWNCYIAQLFSDQSPIVQLDVVVWSENCDIRENAMNHRRDLCSVHKFLHWLLRKEKDVGT